MAPREQQLKLSKGEGAALEEVRIVDLSDMRVASVLGFGTEPEGQAFSILLYLPIAD